jgi:hypothetical protein
MSGGATVHHFGERIAVRLRTTASLLAAGILAVELLAAELLGGCAHRAAAPRPATTIPTAFNGTDLAWIEVNIAMDEQLLPLLTLVPEKAGGDAAASHTAQVKTVTETELAVLRSLHDQAGLPAQNPHEGMPMPGMVTPQELAQARTLTGAAFAKVANAKVHDYLEQGLNLARSEAKAGAEPRTLKLASSITDSRRRLLA